MIPIVGFFTDYAKNLMNDLWHLGEAVTPPAQLYLGFSTGDPLRSGAPAELTAGTAPGYARVQVPAASWSTAADTGTDPAVSPGAALTVNVATITFPADSGTSPWPTACSLFAADAATGGNIIWAARLTPDTSGQGQTCPPGKAISFAPGTLVIQQ